MEVQAIDVSLQVGASGQWFEIRCKLGLGLAAIFERTLLRRILNEKIEGIDHGHIGDQIDGDRQRACSLRHDDAGHEVAERILLPIQEMGLGQQTERVAEDRRPAVGRRPQPKDLRADADEPVVSVRSAVRQGDM